MKRMASAQKNSRSSASFKTEQAGHLPRSGYVLCVSNKKYAASLEKGKLYRRLLDGRSQRLGLVRVIDESGEDYLYPEHLFMSITNQKRVHRVLSSAK
jgi:hypothetical protein